MKFDLEFGSIETYFEYLQKKQKNLNKFGAVRRDKIELIRLSSIRFEIRFWSENSSVCISKTE